MAVLSVGLLIPEDMQHFLLDRKKNTKAISYVDVSGTTGTSLYGSYYYANIAIPVEARDKFISATILSVTDNRYATAQLNSSSQLRVFCDQSGKTVSVRIAYQ